MSTSAFVKGFVVGAVVVGAALGTHIYALNQQKSQVEARLAQVQNAGQQLLTQARELAKPDLPVEVSTRAALLGAGRVLVIRNDSPKELDITAQFKRGDGPAVTQALVIQPNGFTQVGKDQGWTFARGDSVVLSNPDFRPWHNPSITWQ